ncbi:hypothetical protein K493DRAFT_334861 [Basidiobolus meristosporus CBS 931.73]|uniref:Corrinoid adenosyltransferase MMAB n=1 Tax=Basidiobolus meristosporus CBS 931.73 TaxID=1314790 RepID=A0A1Y1YUQ6_9FUNG|nr:hypothetical protein K493DRAFT_334861 [Basidiobolus meristosporus CBS 931.73]|eukprot:ORY01696.1 hypothetical protein K493DRAFT_334861 [Basidiobolus meristosporus CBS 931.73]
MLRNTLPRILPRVNSLQARGFSGSCFVAENKIKIYTKTGDKGTSALFTGERRPKDDAVFEALGTTDELTSYIGLAREFCDEQQNGLGEKLKLVQYNIQDIGGNIATPRSSDMANPARLNRTEFDADGELVAELERWIDELDDQLPPLQLFILPSGGRASSSLHIARSICRRAERRVVPLVASNSADPSTQKYLNRLSDFLFNAARFAAFKQGKEETVYNYRIRKALAEKKAKNPSNTP